MGALGRGEETAPDDGDFIPARRKPLREIVRQSKGLIPSVPTKKQERHPMDAALVWIVSLSSGR